MSLIRIAAPLALLAAAILAGEREHQLRLSQLRLELADLEPINELSLGIIQVEERAEELPGSIKQIGNGRSITSGEHRVELFLDNGCRDSLQALPGVGVQWVIQCAGHRYKEALESPVLEPLFLRVE